ncbi:MAG: tetratricopeptide repeat protein [Bacteroidota bacterium]
MKRTPQTRLILLTLFFSTMLMTGPGSVNVYGQLFDSEKGKSLIEEAAKYVYRVDSARSAKAIADVEALFPDHPVVPLMEAVFILWSEIPMHTTDTVFLIFENKLKEVIAKSQSMPDSLRAEKIFFEMSARGFLAEHYADEGAYLKALGEARRTYGFMKEGFKLVPDAPEFLLTSGLYNYFRVAYPEKHPVYKSLVWLFRSGDKEKGIRQLERAVNETIISRVEAHLYLSYIYLRYEREPEKSTYYLNKLFTAYPENSYFRAKYIESLIEMGEYDQVPVLSDTLLLNERNYYKMSGEVFMGLYHEKVLDERSVAIDFYSNAVGRVEKLRGHGSHYISWAYLGLGRCLLGDEPERATEYLKQAKDFAETKWVKEEAVQLLNKID